MDEGHAAEDAPLAPRSPVRGGQGGRRAARPELRRHPRARRGRDPRLEHVRPVPPSREAHPAVHHQRPRRPAAAAVRRRPPATRLAVRLRPRRRRSTSSSATASPARPTTCAGATERTNREVVTLLLDRLGKPWSLVRTVEDRPGHDRRYAMDGTKLATLGWRPTTGVRGRPRRDRRLVPGQRGVVAGRPARATGTAGTSASTGSGSRPARRRRPCPRPATDARRRHGRRPDASAGPSSPPSPMRRSPGPAGPIAWDRAAFDLDAPDDIGARLDRDRPEVVVHAAAWTDVDGCALDPELAMRRNGVATGRPRGGLRGPRRSTSSSISTNEVFDGTRLDGDGYVPDDPVVAGQPVRRVEGGGRAARAAAFAADPGPRSGSPGRPGCSGRPAATSRAGSSRPPSVPRAAGEPLRVVSDEWGTPTYTADVADAIVELLAEDATAGIHHLVNGLFATRADWARYVARPGGHRGRHRRRPVLRPGSARRGRRAGASSPRRRCRPASRCGRGRTRWPTTRRHSCARCGPGHDAGRRAGDRPGGPAGRSCPASATGRSPVTATRAARSASCGGRASSRAATFVQANLSTSAAGVLRGLHLHRRQDDLWIVAEGRAFVALVDVRPALAGTGPAGRRDPRARRPTTGSTIPTGVAHGFLALEPLQLVYLVTNEYDGSDELGFAWDDPAVGGALAGRSRRPPTAARSSPTGTGPTRRWPTSWCACATTRSDPDPTSPPGTRHRPARWG